MSDDESRSSSGSDSEGSDDGGGGRPMVGFLFGNVDNKMQLQDHYLDEVSRGTFQLLRSRQLSAIALADWH